MLSHFHLIPECHERMDRQTDGQNCSTSILYISVLMRKNKKKYDSSKMRHYEEITL